MDISLPVSLEMFVDKFNFGFKKEDINWFMAKKLVMKRYLDLGYNVAEGDRFEKDMLVAFVRGSLYMDRYIKIKTGDYKSDAVAEAYRREMARLFGADAIKKLLFICRVCSYMGDPAFPDSIIYRHADSASGALGSEVGLRYVYTGEDIEAEKAVFVFLSRALGFQNIKLAALDFTDHKIHDKIGTSLYGAFSAAVSNLEKRVNMENCLEETGVDFSWAKKSVENSRFDSAGFLDAYKKFSGRVSGESKTKGLLKKLEESGMDFSGKMKPEKAMDIAKLFGVNLVEADYILSLHEMVRG